MSNLKVIPSAGLITNEKIEILRDTMFRNFTDGEINFCKAVCDRLNLDPFAKQIHFTKHRDNSTGKETITTIVGIDGTRAIASRSEAYAGSSEPVYEQDEKGFPVKATVAVRKIVQGVVCEFTASARWDEFYPGDKKGFMWRKMPFLMLGKVAESQALRKAFPSELSGIYVAEEMDQAGVNLQGEKKAKEIQAIIEVPKSESGVDYSAYVVNFGTKYINKKLSEIDKKEIESLVRFIEEKVSSPTEDHLTFLANAQAYLEQQ